MLHTISISTEPASSDNINIILTLIGGVFAVLTAYIGMMTRKVSPAEALARESRENAQMHKADRDEARSERDRLREQVKALGETPVA